MAGRPDEAVQLFEHVLADSERILGPEHPSTLSARANLENLHAVTARETEADFE